MRTLVTILVGLSMTLCTAATAADSPSILGYYNFNGSYNNLAAPGKSMSTNANTVLGSTLTYGQMYLNGTYQSDASGKGFRAVTDVLSGLNYRSFAFVAHLLVEGELTDRPILVGGSAYRWFELRMDKTGNLSVAFNNGRSSSTVGIGITYQKWYKIAASVDLDGRTIKVALDGTRLQTIPLVSTFAFEVVGTSAEASDKVFTFTNYSNGNSFRGFVDDLIVFGRALSDDELRQYTQTLPAPPTSTPTTPTSTNATVLAKKCEINGPDTVKSGATATYTTTVFYADGSSKTAANSSWLVCAGHIGFGCSNLSPHATIDSKGTLTAGSTATDTVVYLWGESMDTTYSTGNDTTFTGNFNCGEKAVTIQSAGISTNAKQDCLFDWMEKTYTGLFLPAGSTSRSSSPYYYRYYSSSNSYLGTSGSDNHLYYIGTFSGNKLVDLGDSTTWMNKASCK